MKQDSKSTRPELGLSPLWRIAVLVSAAIAISDLDRQTLPVAVSAIAKKIPLSNQQFSALQSTFLFAYAFMYAGGGKLVAVLGTRRGFTVIMIFWSLACASHALATTVRPVLSVMSREVIHLGPHGSGAMMKLINNFIYGVQAASFAEGLAMVHAAGLDQAKAVRILTEGAPGSGIVKRIATQLGGEGGDPNFTVRLMAKDLAYAVQEASEKGIPLQTAASARKIFKKAVEAGHGDEDFSAVTRAFDKP